MSTTTTTTTTTRRNRRNNTIKNIFLVLMAIGLIILAIFAFKGCNNDTNLDPNCNNTHGFVSTIGGTCSNCSGNNNADNTALLVEIDLLKAENDALKAENESLKSGVTADDKALAEANANAAAWKSKYETLYTTHMSCSSVDLSKYVSINDYNKVANDYNALLAKYYDLEDLYNALANKTVDMSQYVLKSLYDELTTKYNALVAEFAAFKQNHTNCGPTYVEADHSNCVAKSTYQAVVDELLGWRNHQCPTSNHNGCVSQSEYNALNSKYQSALSRISTLEDEIAQLKAHKCPGADHTSCNSEIAALEAEIAQLKAELRQLQAHECDHSNCGSGTTIIQADHSNCVSLRDYNELLAAYNALLND